MDRAAPRLLLRSFERHLRALNRSDEALERYLRVRAHHKNAHLPWLWLGLKGRLTAYGLVMMLRRRALASGTAPRWSVDQSRIRRLGVLTLAAAVVDWHRFAAVRQFVEVCGCS